MTDSHLNHLKNRVRSLEEAIEELSAQPDAREHELRRELQELENSYFLLLVNQLKPRLADEALWKNTES